MQPSLFSTDLDIADAEQWRRDNPDAYELIVEWAYEDASLRDYCSMQGYLEALRSPALARRLGLVRSDKTFLVNNSIKPALTRLVMREHPDLPFHPRKSRVDVGQFTYATPEVRPQP